MSEPAIVNSILQQFKSQIKPCVIDEDCRQKYVLVKVTIPGEEPQFIVRGKRLAGYHDQIAGPLLEEISNLHITDIKADVIGGGRIIHSSTDKKVEIYGHSIGFPWEKDEYRNELAMETVKPSFPGFSVIHDNTFGRY